MDIFGIGAAELIIIGLVIVIIAGPERSISWAREAGRYMRQFSQYVSALMREFEKELGDDGKEIMKTAQELRQTASELHSVGSPTRNIQRVSKMVAGMPAVNAAPPDSATNAPSDAGSDTALPRTTPGPYPGWSKLTQKPETSPVPDDTLEAVQDNRGDEA